MFPQSHNHLDRFVTAGLVVLVIGLSVTFYVALKPVGQTYEPERDLSQQADLKPDTPIAPDSADFTVIWAGEPDLPNRTSTSDGSNKPSADLDGPFDFQLHGIFYDTSGNYTMASIGRNGEQALYGIGAVLSGWEISDIDIQSVTLIRGGEKRTLCMGQPMYAHLSSNISPDMAMPQEDSVWHETLSVPRRADAREGASLQRVKARTASQPSKARPKPRDVDATVAVAANIMERLRDDPTSVKFGASFTPNLDRRGKMHGILLNKIDPGSLAAQYGLAPGDRILSINGQPISSLTGAMELYQRYRGNNSVRVAIERGGLLRTVMFYAR